MLLSTPSPLPSPSCTDGCLRKNETILLEQHSSQIVYSRGGGFDAGGWCYDWGMQHVNVSMCMCVCMHVCIVYLYVLEISYHRAGGASSGRSLFGRYVSHHHLGNAQDPAFTKSGNPKPSLSYSFSNQGSMCGNKLMHSICEGLGDCARLPQDIAFKVSSGI